MGYKPTNSECTDFFEIGKSFRKNFLLSSEFVQWLTALWLWGKGNSHGAQALFPVMRSLGRERFAQVEPMTAQATTNEPIVITGVGLVTSLGNDREAVWRAIQAGRSNVRPLRGLRGLPDDQLFGATVDVPLAMPGQLKVIPLCQMAAREAIPRLLVTWVILAGWVMASLRLRPKTERTGGTSSYPVPLGHWLRTNLVCLVPASAIRQLVPAA